MSARRPADVVRIIEFHAAGPDEPAGIFAEAAEWMADNSPVALVGVCLLYDGQGGTYGLQLAHTVDDDDAIKAAGTGGGR